MQILLLNTSIIRLNLFIILFFIWLYWYQNIFIFSVWFTIQILGFLLAWILIYLIWEVFPWDFCLFKVMLSDVQRVENACKVVLRELKIRVRSSCPECMAYGAWFRKGQLTSLWDQTLLVQWVLGCSMNCGFGVFHRCCLNSVSEFGVFALMCVGWKWRV